MHDNSTQVVFCTHCICDDRACLSVCLSVREHISGTTRPIFTKFQFMLTMSVARFSSGGVAIRYVLPVFMEDVICAHNEPYVRVPL